MQNEFNFLPLPTVRMVNMKEYLADLWGGEEDGEKEPEWVEEERKQFKEFRDKNGDGKLDRQEVEEWILPQDLDHSDVRISDHYIHVAVVASLLQIACHLYGRQRFYNFIQCVTVSIQVETKHLISEADNDDDGVLTKEEIVEKHDLFVGSQATDFGDILLRHDEF